MVPWTNEVDLLIMQQRVQKGTALVAAQRRRQGSSSAMPMRSIPTGAERHFARPRARKMHIGGIDTVHVDTAP